MVIKAQNFDILIGPMNDLGQFAVRVTNCPAGQSREPIYQSLPRQNMEDALLYVQELVAELSDMEELGAELFEFLFPAPVKELFDRSQPKSRDNILRIRLHWDDDNVMANLGRLPWEYAFDKHSFIAHKRNLSLVRFLHTQAPAPLQTPRKIQVLAVSAAPQNMPEIQVKTELENLKKVIREASLAEKIELQSLENVTRKQLRQAITKFQPHVLHFAGHGSRGQNSSGLVLCDENGQADLVESRDLRILLDHGPVRLAILNACETSAQPKQVIASSVAVQSVAAQLVSAGLPAVIGMQYALPDDIAFEFMKGIYTGLFQNQPIDQVMTEVRIALYFDHKVKSYWALPALYLRVEDGHLFTDEKVNPIGVAVEKIDTTELADSVSTGLTALTELMQNPTLHAAIVTFQNEIVKVRHKIAVIKYFKQLHDFFQTLEISYALLDDKFQRLPEDRAIWIDLELDEWELQDTLKKIMTDLQNPPADIEIDFWHTYLQKGGEEIREGVEDKEERKVASGLFHLHRALYKGLPDINKRLVIYADDLPLAELAKSLAQVVNNEITRATGITLNGLKQFKQGISALEQLGEALKIQVRNHNHWQNFDDELRNIHSSLKKDPSILMFLWPEIKDMSETLVHNDREGAYFNKLGALIDKSLDAEPTPAVIQRFRQYRTRAVKRFRDVDDELLKLCRNLEKVGAPLDAILRAIQ